MARHPALPDRSRCCSDVGNDSCENAWARLATPVREKPTEKCSPEGQKEPSPGCAHATRTGPTKTPAAVLCVCGRWLHLWKRVTPWRATAGRGRGAACPVADRAPPHLKTGNTSSTVELHLLARKAPPPIILNQTPGPHLCPLSDWLRD